MAAQGEWVYTAQYGWTWVPYGSTTTTVSEQPYVYLYAPSYGWRWFVSPWGVGPFHYGAWGWGPAWGPRYWPHGWAGQHSVSYVRAPYVRAPYVRSGAVRLAPPRAYGAARVYRGGAHVAGAARIGGFRGFGGFHGGGGHHR